MYTGVVVVVVRTQTRANADETKECKQCKE